MNGPQTQPLPPEVLQQLKDIHPAPEPGFWPPAPGWWLLALLVLATLWWSWHRWQAWRRARAPWRVARSELAGIRARWQAEQNDRWLLRAVSELLRRVARHCHGPDKASLDGVAWLQWLDAALPAAQRGFENGPGRVLARGLYQPRPEVDAEALLQLVEHWLRAQRRGGGRC